MAQVADLADGALRPLAHPDRAAAMTGHRAGADERFLADPVEALLTSRPWSDTLDGLGSAAVSPLCRRDGGGAAAVIDRWSGSGDPWPIRAAIPEPAVGSAPHRGPGRDRRADHGHPGDRA